MTGSMAAAGVSFAAKTPSKLMGEETTPFPLTESLEEDAMSSLSPRDKARPLAAATPTRNPVNEPGPSETAMPAKSSTVASTCASIPAMRGVNSTVW